MRPVTFCLGIVCLNLALAFGARALVPAHTVATTDRLGYEWLVEHGPAPGCPHATFCYRVLVPLLVAWAPAPPAAAWSVYPPLANGVAGAVLAFACALVVAGAPRRAVILASLMAQTSFAFTFASFDPYTPDPAVFVFAALMTWAWLADRPLVALPAALVGVFAKETVALVAVGLALAAVVPPRLPGWRRWLGAGFASLGLVIAFHLLMDRLAGWSLASSPAANLAGGSWLALWVAERPPAAAVFAIFAVFGFGWAFAALGLAGAPDHLRRLALGLALPLLGLVYVQNVERALGNAFLVVIPAAVVFLVRVRVGAALLAVLLNGLLTARVGLSSSLLPPTPLLLVAAGLAAAWTLWRSRLVRLAPAALLLVGLGGCAPTSSDTRPPPGPTATAAAVATRTRESANAQVRRILAGDQGGTPTPSATPTPRPSCADAIWWYEARAHVGEQRTVEGPVVRVRRLPGGTLLELGQLYPDPTGFAVLLTGPLAAQTYADKSVCVSGTITVDEGTPTVRGGDMIAIRVLD